MDIADVLTKTGSLAGAITLAWRAYDAWVANRDRLVVTSAYRQGGGLELVLDYGARGGHAQIRFLIEILSPPGLTVTGYAPPLEWTDERGFEAAVEALLAAENAARKIEVTAVRLPEAAGGTFRVNAEIRDDQDGEVEHARIKVTVIEWPTRRVLVARALTVSGYEHA